MSQNRHDLENWDAKDKKLVKDIYEWVEAAVFSLLCVSIIFTFAFRIVGVDGDSMNTTLFDGERLIISRFSYTPNAGYSDNQQIQAGSGTACKTGDSRGRGHP